MQMCLVLRVQIKGMGRLRPVLGEVCQMYTVDISENVKDSDEKVIKFVLVLQNRVYSVLLLILGIWNVMWLLTKGQKGAKDIANVQFVQKVIL